jgi:LPXTG-site transpeptidase (sortase) family protein
MILKISEKTRKFTKKVAIFCSLFVAIFFILFYGVNFIDFGSPQSNQNLALPTDISSQLQKRLGSTNISMETYADWAKRYGLSAGNDGLDADPDNDGLPNYQEYVYGTNPLKADTDGDGFSDKQEIINGYDPDAPGDARPLVEISISKLNVAAPMVWSKSTNDQEMLDDLSNGVAHYFATASPGQNGNMIISGHSSNYVWAKGDYNHIFKDLNNLVVGDVIKIRTTEQNGRTITYSYKVSDKFVTTADDQKVFANTPNPTLTLSTCWPIGTSLKRLIIKAQLAS